MGLSGDLVDRAIADPSTGHEVRAEHDQVVAAGGYGVPTLRFECGPDRADTWLFGPVLTDPPVGAAAARLWQAVTAWLEFPHLYELQRPKSAADLEHIAGAFAPYLRARDWVSVDRGRVVGFGGHDPKEGAR
jgi:hypothetical protein